MRTADEQLMHRVRGGDSAAMEPLVRRHASELLSFVTRMVRDSAEAEDVFQDVWFAVWRKRTSFDTTRRFRPWLFRIAANRCIDRARRRRPRGGPAVGISAPNCGAKTLIGRYAAVEVRFRCARKAWPAETARA